ncbi:hypothetical protein OF897_18465 [Chryseobacterium formosus]|uniref:Uncharacterized protein n=1 Tax=Chryseobacterium formosus TaxID=1537363 RepID=A0ABT3XW46_9FLAO|nr:hypothetical protein [Chryseobacterium formosus]MCX8525902.1 hypothetical protein [Chryseobacterium formosus]
MMILSTFLCALQDCRSSDLIVSEQDVSAASTISEKRSGDSTRQHSLYPDPPIRDGHDWKSAP